MSKPVSVTISHSLGKDEARQRLQKGLAAASDKLQLLTIEEEIWSGDRMTFRVRAMGHVASGSVDVGEEIVRLEIVLPGMLHRFAEMAEGFLKKRGEQLLLEKK